MCRAGFDTITAQYTTNELFIDIITSLKFALVSCSKSIFNAHYYQYICYFDLLLHGQHQLYKYNIFRKQIYISSQLTLNRCRSNFFPSERDKLDGEVCFFRIR